MQQPQNLSEIEINLQELVSHLARAQEMAMKAKEDCRGYMMPTDPNIATKVELMAELNACRQRHATTQNALSRALQEKAIAEKRLQELL